MPSIVTAAVPEPAAADFPGCSDSDGRLKIVFLGNAYNPVSIACLLSLLRSRHDITVASYRPEGGGMWRLIKRSLNDRGMGFVVRKAVLLGRAKLNLALVRLGLRRRRFVSIDAVLARHTAATIICEDPNSPPFLAEIRRIQPDLIIVAAFSRILRAPLLELPKITCLNVHPSLLPKYRGPNPFYWVLANGERQTGVTVHCVTEQIDAGDVVVQRPVSVQEADNELTLQHKCSAASADALLEAIDLIATGRAVAIPQDEASATYYSMPPRGASRLD